VHLAELCALVSREAIELTVTEGWSFGRVSAFILMATGHGHLPLVGEFCGGGTGRFVCTSRRRCQSLLFRMVSLRGTATERAMGKAISPGHWGVAVLSGVIKRRDELMKHLTPARAGAADGEPAYVCRDLSCAAARHSWVCASSAERVCEANGTSEKLRREWVLAASQVSECDQGASSSEVSEREKKKNKTDKGPSAAAVRRQSASASAEEAAQLAWARSVHAARGAFACDVAANSLRRSQLEAIEEETEAADYAAAGCFCGAPDKDKDDDFLDDECSSSESDETNEAEEGSERRKGGSGLGKGVAKSHRNALRNTSPRAPAS
jgi:hypothetical protein